MNSELGHTAWHIYYLHWVKDCTEVKDKLLLERTIECFGRRCVHTASGGD